MGQMKCEMCGGTDLIKEEGMYTCNGCGTKYSVEEAKKLMQEIDNNRMNNLYERARKSLEVNDLKSAAEYYKQILDENPKDWEAYFYSYLGEFPTFTNAQAASVVSKLGNTIPTACDMAVENSSKEEVAERINIITTKFTERVSGIAATGASLLRQYEGGSVLGAAGKVRRNMYNNIRPTAQNTILYSTFALEMLDKKIEELAGKSLISEETRISSLKCLRRADYNISNWTFRPDDFSTEKLLTEEAIQGRAKKLKEVDPEFVIPVKPTSTSSSSSGGCYVATCVYGSYDCPQVWTLRRYRDSELAATWYGRAFVRTYYAISPTLVKWFGETKWFKKMWKGKLDSMVKKLQNKGVESTPYEDKKW